ncbi:hypothetical protein [uncultured Methanobrevibacter sp.]|uniref:hypothetical protein n=1 Tax=uncultured Methanobrevibacter sp. TaxID=253161 RepID=UPI0025FE2572|nr:hypothetical protein [uncultured Methanobrevibacter sp.]
MIEKSNILKKPEQKREVPNIDIGPIMAAYFLGYLKSQNGDKIADEDIEKLYIGACLKMGIGPVEDISELFQALFGLGEEVDDDKPLQYYA